MAMTVSQSTARWLAPSAFLFNFAAQLYGIFSNPSMKDINDANLSFFSPQPMFIAAYFSVQQIFQLVWLYRIVRLKPAKTTTEQHHADQALDFVPYYSIGNASIGLWMFAWNSSHLSLADFFVVINTATQLFYITTRLSKLDTTSTLSILTHVVSKTFAGIGVLDLLHNTSIAFFVDQKAPFLVKVLTGVGFGLGCLGSDWIMGLSLAYDLAALASGQRALDQGWSNLLWLYSAGAAIITTVKNLLVPPYGGKEASQPDRYEEAPREEV